MDIEMKRCLMITSISFILLFIYYVSLRPDYVMDKDELSIAKLNDKSVDIRLCTVYALMFSSAMGLLYLCVVMMRGGISNSSNSSNAIKVESSTFN
jgi:hypothetical protein